ncbi:MAG: hypothetical protein R2827_13145 [Bdellovibrionales bacterium]
MSRWITQFNNTIGRTLSWLNIATAVLVFVIVIFRYVFDLSWVWMQELSNYFHAFIILSCMAYT